MYLMGICHHAQVRVACLSLTLAVNMTGMLSAGISRCIATDMLHCNHSPSWVAHGHGSVLNFLVVELRGVTTPTPIYRIGNLPVQLQAIGQLTI